MVKISEDLFLGICSEQVRNKFLKNPPKNMFDRVVCLSMLDKEYDKQPEDFDYHLVGDVPKQKLERNFPEIILNYNREKLGDDDNSFDDFRKQLPQLLEILEPYIVFQEKRILIMINCLAGIKRSAAMCMAVLMKTMKINADESLGKISSVRSVVNPPKTFVCVLKNYDFQ